MLEEIKKVFKHSSIYGIGTGLSTVILTVILVPIYTRYLTTSEYGLLEVVNVIIAYTTLLFGLGLHSAILRFYSIAGSEERKKVVTTSLLTLILCATLSSLLLFYIIPLKGFYFAKIEGLKELLVVLVLINFTAFIIPIFYTILRAEEKSIPYIKLSIYGLIATVVSTIYLVVYLKRGVQGALESKFISNLIVIIASFYIMRQYFYLSFDYTQLKKLLKFGLPLVPSLLMWHIIELSDRLFLQYYCNLSEVGIYALGYRYTSLLLIPIMAFQLAWAPFLFSISDKEYKKEIESKTITYYVLGICFLALCLIIFSEEIIKLLTTPAYYAAYKIVYLITLSYFFYGGYVLALGVNYIIGKTTYVPVASFIGAAINIILNFLLIPKYGMQGAALSALVSYFAMCVTLWLWNNIYYKVYLEWNRIAKIIITFLICSIIFFIHLPTSFLLTILLKLVIIVCFILIIKNIKFLEQEEIKTIKSLQQELKIKLSNYFHKIRKFQL